MAAKSDFAQKLLHDLRLRKERMAAGEQSSRRGSQTSRAVHGNSGRTSNGAQRINEPEPLSSRTGNTSRRSSGSRSINIHESSNQIVLYESGGQSSRQVKDLTMAIAFAFENSGNLSKISASNSNPLVNFFNRFGRRSMGSQKMDITNFNIHGLSVDQFPNVSNIQVGEISKGVQKLNQILRSCSCNGFNFDRNSIEVGKELLKGAIDLEESLRMLVNLQESTSYMNRSQSKSRIKLLDEDEDEQDDNDKIADQWKLDRPRFSFDKPSKNSYANIGANKEHQLALPYPNRNSDTNSSKLVHHKRSPSHVQDLGLSTQVKLNGNSSSSQSPHEKGRISNVIAKLMGLEELPQKEGSKGIKVDLKGKERKQEKVLQGLTKLPEHQYRESGRGSPLNNRKSSQTNNVPPIGEPKLQLKSEKNRDAPGGISKMASSERTQLQTSVKIPAVSMESVSGQKPASITMNKKQRHASGSNHTSALQSFEDSERKQNLTKDKESKVIDMESNKSVLSTQVQQMPQKSRTAKAEDNRFEHKNNKSLEKRNLKTDFPGSQQKTQDPRVTLQDHVPKRTEHPEDKGRAEQRDQQFQKQNLIAKKQEGHQMEMLTASKSKRSTTPNLKKLPRDKPSPSSEKSLKPNEKVSMGDSPNRRHKEVTPMIPLFRETSSDQENLKKAGQSHEISSRESQSQSQSNINNESSNQVLAEEKPIEISATQMKAIPRKVQKSEIPQKIDVLVTRRNATMNHMARSRKQPGNILKELKQKMQSQNHSSKRMNEQSRGKVNEEKELISMCDALYLSTETVSQQDTKSQIEAGQKIVSTGPEADESKIQNTHQNVNHDGTDLNSGKVSEDLQPAKESYAVKDGQKLKESDQIGDHEGDRELYKLSQHEPKQFPSWAKQEQLTEPEKDLKEILIKSQLFLSTAEALFKLNIPVSLLHVGDHDYEVAKKKLVLDSAYEIMKRKARRHGISFHPYLKNPISYNKVSSLDDLVKKLCKDLEILKFYGANEGDVSDVAASLYAMLNNDIYDKNPDVNCMWDLEWSKMMLMFPEKDEVIRDIERHMLNGLLDEITSDLLIITVSV